MKTATKSRSDKKNMTGVPCREVDVLDLRVGMKIVTVFGRSSEFLLQELIGEVEENDRLTDQEIAERIDEILDTDYKVALKSQPVKDLTLCPRQWRTHVHINGNQCYDERGKVWVVA